MYPSSDYVMITNSGMGFTLSIDLDPITFEEASKDQRWIETMNQEIDSI